MQKEIVVFTSIDLVLPEEHIVDSIKLRVFVADALVRGFRGPPLVKWHVVEQDENYAEVGTCK